MSGAEISAARRRSLSAAVALAEDVDLAARLYDQTAVNGQVELIGFGSRIVFVSENSAACDRQVYSPGTGVCSFLGNRSRGRIAGVGQKTSVVS